jgi:hypothetical protein
MRYWSTVPPSHGCAEWLALSLPHPISTRSARHVGEKEAVGRTGMGHVLCVWEKTARRSAQMSKKPNQTEARRREPTSISHHPSAGTPFCASAMLPAVNATARRRSVARTAAEDKCRPGPFSLLFGWAGLSHDCYTLELYESHIQVATPKWKFHFYHIELFDNMIKNLWRNRGILSR